MEDIQSIISNYQGSASTYRMVANQIRQRYGEEEVAKYDPRTNCLTMRQWNRLGRRVVKGEKALKSITFIETVDENGETKKYPKTVNLFYYKQTESA